MTRQLPLLLLALGLLGCPEDERSPVPFDPIGRPTDGGAADPAPPDEPGVERLRLRFEPIEHDAGALRITDMVFLPDGSGELLVLDKDGEVIHLRLEGDRAVRLGGFVLEDVWSNSDAGLISVALDPAFGDNGFFYLGYTESRSANVILRLRLDPDDYPGTRASAVTVLRTNDPRAQRSWHNIGAMGFSPEGDMWVLMGDKTVDETAADPHSPLGGILRIRPSHDPDGGYDVPPDNPYADGSGHPAVWAKGLRSPWTGFMIDGAIWSGDIGLDSYEEVNVADRGGISFGWPDYEGPCPAVEGCAEGNLAPRTYYGRSSSHPFVRENPHSTSSRLRSVWVAAPHRPAGDDPYRGLWRDVALFGDLYVGYVRAIPLDGGDSFAVGHLHFATSFAPGPDGYVYVSALGTWPVDAPIRPSPIFRAVLDD